VGQVFFILKKEKIKYRMKMPANRQYMEKHGFVIRDNFWFARFLLIFIL